MFSRVKLRLKHIRKFARLFAGIFAVQVIAAGACLMVPEANAMSMPAMSSVMEHCDSMDMGAQAAMAEADMSQSHGMPMQHHGHSGCPHCDQPDSMTVSHVAIDHTPLVLAILPAEVELADMMVTEPALTVRVPTGPPRSSSLIYQTTQRIRI